MQLSARCFAVSYCIIFASLNLINDLFTFSTTRITAVEIDPIMLEVAEQYFELKQDDRFHVVIDDGLNFIERCHNEGKLR